MGIFIQPDWWEVTEAGVGTNRYSYSFNDPVNLMDPGGNASVGCLDNCAQFAHDTDNEIERLTNERESDPQHSDAWYEQNIEILKRNSAAYQDLVGLTPEERATKFAQTLVEQGSAAIVPAGPAASQMAKTQAANVVNFLKGLIGKGGPKKEELNRIYSARELQRRADSPKRDNTPNPNHNFPESFNKDILSGTKTIISDKYTLYSKKGSLNGRSGTYEIGVMPSASGRTEVIRHRFFRPDKKKR